MSWSKVQICQMAAAKAGSTETIHALEFAEGTAVPELARQCNLYWDLAFEATARAGNFACLQRTAVIAANLVATAIEGYGYRYSLPADYLGWPEFPTDTATVARRVGRVLHTDRAVTQLLYVARTNDTDLFDPLFVEALVLRLAAYLAAGPIGGSDTRRAEALDAWLARVAFPLAAYVNSAEVPPPVLDSSEWRDSRW
jgi:hypothetical protein